MKKILAGVLAAASLLTMTVSASAAATNEKKVAAAGEVEYDVAVTAPKIVLNLVMPAKMEAALNPYGAEIKLDESTPVSNGIVSAAYKINNLTEDYGVWIDATATTTVTRAVKTETWAVKEVVDGKKSAALALVGGNTVADIETAAGAAIADAAATADAQGALVMDSTKAADTTNKIPAGQTKMKKMMFIGAEAEAYMAFIGDLGTGADDEWFEDDAINVALVLKVSAGPTSFSGAGGSGAGSFTATVNKSECTFANTDFVVGNLVANDTYAVAFDAGSNSATTVTFGSKTLDSASSSDTGVCSVNAGSGKITAVADGTTTITYTFDDSTSIKFQVTVTNA